MSVDKEQQTNVYEIGPNGEKQLNSYLIKVVSKYLNSVEDCVNITKVCKKYRGLIEECRQNPVPLKRAKEREIFKNIETYCIYEKDKGEIPLKEIDVDVNTDIEKPIIIRENENEMRFNEFNYWPECEYEDIDDDDNEIKRKMDCDKYVIKRHVFEVDPNQEEEYYENISLIKIPIYRMKGLFSDMLTHVTLPSRVTILNDYLFGNCINLTKIDMPTYLEEIGNSCFVFCSQLEEISIPSTVTSIEQRCFYGCQNLNNIIFEVNPETKNCNLRRLGKRCIDITNIDIFYIPSSVREIEWDITDTDIIYILPEDLIMPRRTELYAKQVVRYYRNNYPTQEDVVQSQILMNSLEALNLI